jgi:uncharacterized membrane protein SpoIIM required for sporulation
MTILMGLFGGFVVGLIVRLLDYHASPLKRFWLFIVSELIGFACAGVTKYHGTSKKR